MKNRIPHAVCFAVVLSASGLVEASSPNVILNGDFEAGNTGFTTAYAYRPGDVFFEATYDVVSNPILSHGSAVSFTDHTSGTGLMLMANNSGIIGDVIWEQTVTVDPDTPYQLSLWHANWDGLPPPVFRVEIDGSVSLDVTSTQTAGTWDEFTFDWTSGAATSATIRLVNRSTAVVGNDLAIDDISLTVIPEPSTAALFTSAIILLAGRFKGLKRD